MQQAIRQEKAEIDISHFENGIYFLNAMMENNEIKNITLIKQ